MADMNFIGWALENGYTPESLADRATAREARDAYRSKDRPGPKNKRRTVTAVLLTRAGEAVQVFSVCGSPRTAKTAALAWCMLPGNGDFEDYSLVIDTPVPLSEIARED